MVHVPSLTRSRSRRRAALLPVALVAAGVLGAACSSPPSLSAYRAQAAAICTTYAPQLRTVYSDVVLSTVRGNAQLQADLRQSLPSISDGSSRLSGLAQPSSNDAIQRALAKQTAEVGALQALRDELAHGQRAAAQRSLAEVSRNEAPTNLALNLAGLTSCASGGKS
jgi:hypothetical protein